MSHSRYTARSRNPARTRSFLRLGVVGLGFGWALASGDLLLDRLRHPRAVTGFDLALPYLWTGALVLTVGALALRLLLGLLARWEVSGTEELYDLESDPWEHRSLTAWAPELLEPARRRLDALETRFRNLRRRYGLLEENAPPDLDRATRRQLQALGYVR